MPDNKTLLAILLQKAKSLSGTDPDNIWGLPWSVPHRPGEGNDISTRDLERAGLPGTHVATILSDSDHPAKQSDRNWWSGSSTPDIDPRLVNPTNNPMESLQSLRRGDIELPPQGSGLKPHEDISRLLAFWQAMKQQGFK